MLVAILLMVRLPFFDREEDLKGGSKLDFNTLSTFIPSHLPNLIDQNKS